MTNQNKAYLFAGLTIFFWSTVATAFKLALTKLDIISLITVSSATSLIILILFVMLQGKFSLVFQNFKSSIAKSALYGLINPFLYYLVLFKAYSILPAQIAQPVNMTWPLILVVLSSVILKQPISRKGYLALCISFVGVIITSSRGGSTDVGELQPNGIALALCSALIWSLYWILNMKDDRDEEVKLMLNFLFATIYIFIIYFLFNSGTKIGFYGLINGVYIGVFEMGLSFIFWLKALKYSETTDKVSNLIFITPFVSLFFIHLVVKEELYWTTFVGLILIVVGIMIQKK